MSEPTTGGWVLRPTGGIWDLQANPWRGCVWQRQIGATDRWSAAVYHEKREAMHSDAYYSLADAQRWAEHRLAAFAGEKERQATALLAEAATIRAALAAVPGASALEVGTGPEAVRAVKGWTQ